MATIKAIEGRSVHQIQSGQVIVDLCSVVKELVENSLDAGATSLDVRFKGNALESIEVQDNGSGINPQDYETIGLKHYTSKLSSYDDLGSLDTFGFRGEAISSLCALSKFHIVTAQDGEAPRGKRLDFEVSGALKGTSVTACQKGTIVAVEDLFYNLPVRRKELEKNIKREYSKVLGVLHAYACISTGVKFSVSNQITKGKKAVVFATKSNHTTKENISNVYGAKTITALIPLNLKMELEPSTGLSQIMKDSLSEGDPGARTVCIVGHVSRPVFGEGRQTPDRQLFFVNGRPCGLPQIAKAFNEVYKSFNVSQSPFIFADLRLDTNAYDVNVSPDKRTILLHDQNALLDSVKTSLTQLFEGQDQTVPQSQLLPQRLPAFRPLTLNREGSVTAVSDGATTQSPLVTPISMPRAVDMSSSALPSSDAQDDGNNPTDLLQKYVEQDLIDRHHVRRLKTLRSEVVGADDGISKAVQDFNNRIASQRDKNRRADMPDPKVLENTIPVITTLPRSSPPGPIQLAYDRSRPQRLMQEEAVITVGDKASCAIIGSPFAKRAKVEGHLSSQRRGVAPSQPSRFAQNLRAFNAPGTQAEEHEQTDELDSGHESSDPREERGPFGGPQDDKSVAHGREPVCDIDVADEDVEDPPLSDSPRASNYSDSDDEYIDEDERKRRDEAQIEKMVRQAEAAAAQPTQQSRKKVAALLKSSSRSESTTNLIQNIDISVSRIHELLKQRSDILEQIENAKEAAKPQAEQLAGTQGSPEESLSLTISKADFAEMHVVGQFNLGFILATRPATSRSHGSASEVAPSDDLFIIDQHASDEIFNFHRLSASTSLTPQPLVKPHHLNLTAIEEETVISSLPTLQKNGFTLTVDESGDEPVGTRCKLLALPTSRETTFDLRDLEELISLLGETSLTSSTVEVVRPSKVRKMLAMRACRSSIMVGRTLTPVAMERVLRHMGQIDKPWNCPHGRPTMRHLACLDTWQGWSEGDGLTVDQEDGEDVRRSAGKLNWGSFLARTNGQRAALVRIDDALTLMGDVEEDTQDEELEAKDMAEDTAEEDDEETPEDLFIGDDE